jgi:hypothetical protein
MKFPAFYWTRRFITAFTSARHLSLSWASPIQSIPPHPTSWRSILILLSMVQRLLASVAGRSGSSVKKCICKGPLKKLLVKSRKVATEVFERPRRLEAKTRNLCTDGESSNREVWMRCCKWSDCVIFLEFDFSYLTGQQEAFLPQEWTNK